MAAKNAITLATCFMGDIDLEIFIFSFTFSYEILLILLSNQLSSVFAGF